MLLEHEGTFAVERLTRKVDPNSENGYVEVRSPIGEMIYVSVGYYLASRSLKIFIHEVNIFLFYSVFLFFINVIMLYKNRIDGSLFLSYLSSSTLLSFLICVLIEFFRYHRIS